MGGGLAIAGGAHKSVMGMREEDAMPCHGERGGTRERERGRFGPVLAEGERALAEKSNAGRPVPFRLLPRS